MGNVGGDLIPLGIASLAAYIREKGYGVGVLECPGLGIDADKVHKVIKEKNPGIIAFSSTTYRLLETKKIAKKITYGCLKNLGKQLFFSKYRLFLAKLC